MARGGKRGRKPKGAPRSNGSGSLTTTSTKTNEFLGIKELEIDDEESEQEEGSKQMEVDITEWADLAAKLEQDVACGKRIAMPILKLSEEADGTVQRNSDEKEEVRITKDDIEDKVNFLKPSIVGYVAGANPPVHVLEGFVRRIWKEVVDRVGMIAHGIFLIRFTSEEA